MKNTRLTAIVILALISICLTVATWISTTYDLDIFRTKNDAVTRMTLAEVNEMQDVDDAKEVAVRYINFHKEQRESIHKRGIEKMQYMTVQAVVLLLLLILTIIEIVKRKKTRYNKS